MRESIERRRPHHLARRHAEHAAEIDERSERAMFEPEDRRLFAALLDHGVLIERQRRQAGETIVRENADDVAVDGAATVSRS